jgi:hypothetical protein
MVWTPMLSLSASCRLITVSVSISRRSAVMCQRACRA